MPILTLKLNQHEFTSKPLSAIIEKRLLLDGGRAVIVEDSLVMGQSTGHDGRKSRTDTRSAPSERPRK
jgi:hypothetical protein